MPLINRACPECGSVDRVVRDAFASWDVDTQSWVLASVDDNLSCNACGTSAVTPEEIEATEEEEDAGAEGET
ncbi:hypothetical protein ACE7GA_05520 [Roseomonas sp. CCTCC AB2023176]|uniref:hypothetical protein n=1 Tax=Roseomonas sp. CCTCC AB2023176 TaxID=3342640 RepID=UPI0035DBF2D2